MKSDPQASVAVVGAGFSGTMTAVHLVRRGIPVRLFDAGHRIGRGIAYGTDDPSHLLNVPAAKMSAWPDRPDDFCNWLDAEPGTFAARRDFGAYLGQILAAHPQAVGERAAVTRLERAGNSFRLHLDDGVEFGASAIVLALGNQPPQAPAGWGDVPLIADPWGDEAHGAIAEAAAQDWPVLLIGTGLTMVDVMLSLDTAGYAGRALAVSRRGRLPHVHAAHDPAPVSFAELPVGNLLALWRWLRRRSGEVGFRAAVDSLRPHTAALWQLLPLNDRLRFLRHVQPWWDVHRHRLAPKVAVRLEALIASGRLEVAAARLRHAQGEELMLQDRRGTTWSERPRLVINCTGPLGDVRRSRDPLLRQLLDAGMVETDPLGLGLATDRHNRAAAGIWAVGPMTRGMYWEMTAVPDIRGQAERIAAAIEEDLRAHG